MYNFIIREIPALYILVHLFTSLFILFFKSQYISRLIYLFSSAIALILAAICFSDYSTEYIYYFGDWRAPVGISFKYNLFAAISLVFIAFINFYWVLFSKFTIRIVENVILPGRKNLHYSLFSILHASFAGLILTNDLFNLYVFIEISALASYGLLAISEDKRSFIGALDYLLIGTIGATLILIGIGLIFASFGTLNLDDIYNQINSNPQLPVNIYNTAKAGCIFILVGSLIKIAMFPLHWWQLRAYVFTSPIIAANIATFSSYIALAIIIKLQYQIYFFFINKHLIILNYVGSFVLIYGAFRALFEDNLRRIIVFSSVSQVGLYAILLSNFDLANFKFLWLNIIADSMAKFSIFIFISSLNSKKLNLMIHDLIGLAKSSPITCVLMSVFLVNAAGLPFTFLFVNKTLIANQQYIMGNFFGFISVILSSFVTALYYIRIARQFYKTSETEIIYNVDHHSLYSIFIITIILFAMLISYSDFEFIAGKIYEEFNSARSI